jgi:adenine-specific DNA-methyltransferase
MEAVSVRRIAAELQRSAERWLPAIRERLEGKSLAPWFELHGWASANEKAHLLVARQAVLLGLIRRSFPHLDLFKTPLDGLTATIASEISVDLDGDIVTEFNFWGQLYNAVIPQADRRRIGQFWTSELIADWMTAWLLECGPKQIADIGCGSGSFLCKAAGPILERQLATTLYGCDTSPLILNVARANLASQRLPLLRLVLQDYLANPLPSAVDAVICNPPYTRHHHVPPALKDKMQSFFRARFHLTVSRQATMASYFLLKMIAELPEGGHAAIILPMEVLDARYGNTAKAVLCRETILSAIIHFSPEMNAFAKVDVGASILLFRKGSEDGNRVKHLTVRELPTTGQLLGVLNREEPHQPEFGSLIIQPQRELANVSKWFAITSALLVPSELERNGLVVPLKQLAHVMRGIATGANAFFALSTSEVAERSLERFVVRTIQRNREIQDIVLDEASWEELSDEGKRVWLLYLNRTAIPNDPYLRTYILEGEARGFHQRSLVSTRKPWCSMEQRRIPPIFFTILTRGNPRFILNRAGVRPLNMFSLLYPKREIVESDCTEILWALLNSDFSLSKLHSVSRTYGGNTLKVEPRELDNLPVLNPLAFPEDAREHFESIIADLETHRRTDVFMREVNRLVQSVLTTTTPAPGTAVAPKQLQLMEPRGRYRTKRSHK